MIRVERRVWLQTAAASLVAAALPGMRRSFAESKPDKPGCTLSIGTYSLKGMPLESAIDLLAGIGYDGIEIATQPGFDGEPAKMSSGRRKEVCQRLAASRLRLTSIMEQLSPAIDDRQHQDDLRRLQLVAEMTRQLAPINPPLVQTVLGGGQWEQKKTLFRDRLGDWVRVFKDAGLVLAIKPHRGGGMSRPEEAIWLIQQLDDSPWLRMVYDYSHYAFRDMPVDQTVRTALPYTAHLVVKDAVDRSGRIEFLPPGESGTFDYGRLLRLFYEGGYRGDVCCEISSMVWKKPNYDPSATAKACCTRMAEAFAVAQIPRVKRV